MLPALAAITLLAACNQTGSPSSSKPRTEHVSLVLQHQPLGTARFALDRAQARLTVDVQLTGLAPSTAHPVDIRAGACGARGEQLMTLGAANANAHGNAELNATVDRAVVPAGDSVVVHAGPGLDTPAEARVLACGNVIRTAGITFSASPSPSASATTLPADAYATLNAVPLPPDNPSGTATLDLDRQAKTLTVTVNVTGLEPDSVHPNHIHTGACQSQGSVVYPLTDLHADAAGTASATTTIQNVTDISYGQWYVNVHQGPGLGDQAGFAPILCADVVSTGEVISSGATPSPTPTPTATPVATPTVGASLAPVASPTVAPRPSPSVVVSPSATASP
jgi:hypothetical protein